MFQRAQTIWISLACMALTAMFIFPISNKDVGGILLPVLYTRGYASSWDTGEFITVSITPIYPLLIAHITLIILCFINIFNYERRSFQKRFAILLIVLIGAFAFWCSIYAKKLQGGIESASFGIGAYLPAIAILFIVLAVFGINNDEKIDPSGRKTEVNPMIQKPQTIWLFLAPVALLAMFFFPIATIQEPHITYCNIFFVQGIERVGCFSSTFSNRYLLLIINIAIATFCFINIFNFKNRNKQKRIAIISILLIFAFIIVSCINMSQLPGNLIDAYFGISAYLLALAILFIVLAISGINKDERLIRSAERLR